MIPKTVKIGWRTYVIEQAEYRANSEEFTLGEIAYDESRICLYRNRSDQSKQVTLIHEVLHAIFYHIGRGDLRDDETFIDALTENLYQVMLDNSGLFVPIVGEEDKE